MSERACPQCGSQLELVETQEDPGHRDESLLIYACPTSGCEGRLEEVSEHDAAVANEPTGGDNIGA